MEYLVVPNTLELRTRGRLAGLGGAGAQWQVPLSWKSSYRLLFKVHVLTYCVDEY